MNWEWDKIPKQTELVENGKTGDCWRCCIAAILRRPASEVPHFLAEALKDREGPSMDPLTQQWLTSQGYWLMHCVGYMGFPRAWREQPEFTDMPVIICGPSPRSKQMGAHHACVAVNGDRIVYDPHPSNAGLTAITDRFVIIPHYK